MRRTIRIQKAKKNVLKSKRDTHAMVRIGGRGLCAPDYPRVLPFWKLFDKQAFDQTVELTAYVISALGFVPFNHPGLKVKNETR